MDSEKLFKRSLQVSPGGVHSPVRSFKSVGGTPIFFKSAKGAFLYDVEEREYIDFCMSFGPLILGHRDPEIQDIAQETVETAWSFGAADLYSLDLAEFIVEEIPWIDKIRFVSSGTEAVMSAIRVARAVTGRDKVLKFDGCYHGHVDSLLVKAGSGLAGEASSDSAGIGKSFVDKTLVLPLDDERAVEEVFGQYGKDISCVIIEPIPANFGLLVQRNEFIEKVTQIAQKNCSLVIFDEVISGFRVGMRGMSESFSVKPDLVTYGKIIGGGFPVGAYAGKKEFMDLVAPSGPVYQAGTLSANPIGMRAGLATLKKLKRDDVHEVLKQRTESFMKEFVSILNSKSEVEWDASFYSSLFWLHQKSSSPIRRIDKIPANHKENFAKLFNSLLKQSVYLAPSGYEVGFLSFAHTEQVLESTLAKLKNI